MFFFFQAEDGIRDIGVTGVQTCALPISIYHDPDLPPTHHYLAAYWWMIEEFGADGIVHLGKHGTLEWLPGKSLGLSPSRSEERRVGKECRSRWSPYH